MSKVVKLFTPLSDQAFRSLKVGAQVSLTGKIYTARDAAHKRFGTNPPVNLKGKILFYASPTPAKPGQVIGSIGPTTASRMDAFTPGLLKQGLKAMIGKGERGAAVIAAIKKYRAVYFLVPGGTAAFLSKHIVKSTVVAYPDLGPEAVLELEVKDFPVIVAIDSKGKDLFSIARKRYQRK